MRCGRARLLKCALGLLMVWTLERLFEERDEKRSPGPASGATDHLASWPPESLPTVAALPATAASTPAAAPPTPVGALDIAPASRPEPPPAAAGAVPPVPPPPPPVPLPPPPPAPAAGPSVLKDLTCTDPVAPGQPRVAGCTLAELGSLTETLRGGGDSARRLGWGTAEEAAAPLVPLPASVRIDALNTRRLTSSTVLVLKAGAASTSAMVLAAAKRFAEQLAAATAGELRPTVCAEGDWQGTAPAAADTIILSCDMGEPAVLPPLMAASEAYTLVVPSLTSTAQPSILLSAGSAIGLVRGLATLAQLMASPVAGSGSALIPVVEIEDRPAHSWRGLLIDVARHFIPMDTVLNLLPLCAAVKINVLHIHLTDDQGWRYESVAHPELNRPASTGGNFYSQAEVKKLVAAAHLLGIRVVPELNFPAHTDAAFIAFPWLGSKRITSINPKWGKHDTCAVPGDQTWALVTSTFEELATLFPDEYVHIGGATDGMLLRQLPQHFHQALTERTERSPLLLTRLTSVCYVCACR